MNYIQYIEESKSWTCPKSGIWKVICVGGGGGGYSFEHSNPNLTAQGGAGGTSSFGSYISAAGGNAGNSDNAVNGYNDYSGNLVLGTSGINGYDGASGYGTVANKAIGIGYGASGGAACSKLTYNSSRCAPGEPGSIKMCILDLDENKTVACTVGAAGTGEKASSPKGIAAYAGMPGAIIVQYLGESM